MKITKQQLLSQYNLTIDKILDECDWKTHFISQEICGIVCNILTENEESISITPQDLYKLYHKKVKDLNISDELWRENYGVQEIISMIYEILISLDGEDSQVL